MISVRKVGRIFSVHSFYTAENNSPKNIFKIRLCNYISQTYSPPIIFSRKLIL